MKKTPLIPFCSRNPWKIWRKLFPLGLLPTRHRSAENRALCAPVVRTGSALALHLAQHKICDALLVTVVILTGLESKSPSVRPQVAGLPGLAMKLVAEPRT